jgi:hypothetical protein
MRVSLMLKIGWLIANPLVINRIDARPLSDKYDQQASPHAMQSIAHVNQVSVGLPHIPHARDDLVPINR